LSHVAVWAPVSIACSLMVMIYAFGGISGANFNPAVSFALGLSTSMGGPGDMKWSKVGMYAGVQIAAGILAGLCYSALFGAAIPLAPAKGFGFLAAGMCEFFYTFMLVFVVLNTAVTKDAAGKHFYGLAIGFVIIAGAYGAGAISGGCFNPAVAIGIDLSSAMLGFGWCLVYTVFELLGAATAVMLFKVVRPKDFNPELTDEEAKTMVTTSVSEFLGTFMLVLTVGLNVLAKSPAAAYSIAASLMCMIYALGDVSGAKFNPAVSLAVAASGVAGPAYTPKDMIIEWVVQIAGGITAAFTYMLMYFHSFPLGPGAGYTLLNAGIAEIVFTFVLCLVVLTVACHPKTATKDMYGLAIGSCVTVGGFAIGAVSGGSLNPAVSWGIAMAAPIALGKSCMYAAAYTGFEFAGAAFAAGLVKFTHDAASSKEEAASA